ncbi:MAG: hypothetical protein IKC71_02975 [Clostridia bacterium]|nr:hypothetical protein [Clostridia bacterium]
MTSLKTRIIIIIVSFCFLLFFSNDFGIIDIEKTAIITAIGIDKKEDEYEITAQIALPEAKNTSAKNEKSVISSTGSTVSSAITKIGSISGWYPKLSFCNLILINQSFLDENIINLVNYFTKTLNVQDSTLIAITEDSAKEVLKTESPLDDLSSFAIQKILLKKTGLNNDILETDIKTFSIGYYGKSGYSYLPYIKTLPPEGEESGNEKGGNELSKQNASSGSEGQSQSGKEKQNLFDATTTLLFNKGKVVEKLNKEETFAVNLMTTTVNYSTLEVNDCVYQGEHFNVLLDVLSVNKKISLKFVDNKPFVTFKLDVFVKIDDQNSINTDLNGQGNSFVPEEVCKKAEEDLKSNLKRVVEKSKSGVDVFDLIKKLYRHHYKYYEEYKESILKTATYDYQITFHGQQKEI